MCFVFNFFLSYINQFPEPIHNHFRFHLEHPIREIFEFGHKIELYLEESLWESVIEFALEIVKITEGIH